jgi:predicted DNA-binding WGR domain protein
MDLKLMDVELRLVDPKRNRFRLYGVTRGRTLFGERCLQIVWGRMGHARMRERTETFANVTMLEQRWKELLERRRQHGYVPLGTSWDAILGYDPVATAAAAETREIVEAHGLAIEDRKARTLVLQWARAARRLQSFVRVRAQTTLDLEDVSTLAAMYAAAAGLV